MRQRRRRRRRRPTEPTQESGGARWTRGKAGKRRKKGKEGETCFVDEGGRGREGDAAAPSSSFSPSPPPLNCSARIAASKRCALPAHGCRQAQASSDVEKVLGASDRLLSMPTFLTTDDGCNRTLKTRIRASSRLGREETNEQRWVGASEGGRERAGAV